MCAIETGIPDEVRPFIHQQQEYYFTDSMEYKLPFYADGLPGLVYLKTFESVYQFPTGKALSSLFLYGQSVTPITLRSSGPGKMIVVFLKPSALYGLFGLNASSLTDSCLDLLDLLNYPSALVDAIELAAMFGTDPLPIMWQEILQFGNKKKRIADSIVENALYFMQKHVGSNAFYLLKKDLPVSERTLERKFLQQVGVRPKTYSRILQFNHTLKSVQRRKPVHMTRLAYDLGFTDQSHMIRSFKEFTGLAPGIFSKNDWRTKQE